jgi:uncharacterized protein YneF (UPF0154 family)
MYTDMLILAILLIFAATLIIAFFVRKKILRRATDKVTHPF